MRCGKCGGKITGIPMRNQDGVKGRCYFCNSCHHSFWKSIDGKNIESHKKKYILGVDLSEREVNGDDQCKGSL